MGNLDELLPKQTPTVEAIFAYHKRKGDAEPQRGYLGASIVGHECERFLWFAFRGVVREEIEGRAYRLFETGDLAEARFVAELRAIGCTVHDRDEKGEQFAVEALGGHLSGHTDGVVVGLPEAPKTPHVLETKTKNAANFRAVVKHGVKKEEPQHYSQMQTYMGLLKLDRALYLVVNKDDDDLYSERVEFNRPFFEALLRRAKRIIETSQAPDRCATRADDYRCKLCPAQKLCWGDPEGKAPAVPIKGGQTCRSCCHATAETDKPGAVWSCAKFSTVLESTDVGAECPAHLLLPGMVACAEPTNSDDDWIEFTSRDGTKWRHGVGSGAYSTKALLTSRGPLEAPEPPGPPQGGAASSAAAPPSSPATPSVPSASATSPSDVVLCPACTRDSGRGFAHAPPVCADDAALDVWEEGRE